MTFLVMDLGGTRLKVGVADDAGTVVRRHIADVPRDGTRADLLAMIVSAGSTVLAGDTASAAGLCVPGLVDDGRLVSLPGKHDLVGEDFIAFLRKEFGVAHAVVSNDGVAYATGESSAGAGVGVRRSVVVTIGTGIGVGVMEDGRPVSGGVFGAGILGGFIPISDAVDGPRDTTEQPDTIEALCLAQRIVELAGGAYDTVPEVYAGYARDESAARIAIDRYRARLSRALVALAHAHAPDRIILGGGPMQSGNPVIDGLEEMVNARLFGSYRVQIALAKLGDDAALLGLAHLLKAAR